MALFGLQAIGVLIDSFTLLVLMNKHRIIEIN